MIPQTEEEVPGRLTNYKSLRQRLRQAVAKINIIGASSEVIEACLWTALNYGEAFFSPAPESALHGDYTAITHALQAVCSQSGSIASTAIENKLGVEIGKVFFDVSFQDASAQVKRPRQPTPLPFMIFADINQCKGFAALLPFCHFF